MLKISNFFSIFFFFICINKICAQNEDVSKLSNEEIERKIDKTYNLDKKKELINFYIKKSKAEKNYESLIYAYRYASNIGEFSQKNKYADSAIAIANQSQNKKLLTYAYLNRGTILMNSSFYERSLDDILIANKYSFDLGDQYIFYKTQYHIAQDKIYLGLYDDANKELEGCINYFRSGAENSPTFGKDYQMYYLYSLMSYIDSNTKLGKQNENPKYLNEAFDYINKNKLNNYLPYFISSEGTDAYYSKDYNTAIKKLSQAIRLYNDNWPHITEVYYLGLSYWKIDKRYTSIKYLEEIDHIYNKTNKLNPQFRSAYELLIKYNDSVGNRNKQLEYINKLILLDKSYEQNYKYLYTKINKEYDTQKLINEKDKIEKKYKLQRLVLSLLLFISLGFVSYYVNRYSHLQKIYKQRFDEIISRMQENNSEELLVENTAPKEKSVKPKKHSKKAETEFYDKIPGLKPQLVKSILEKLKRFEDENGFLDNQISQKMLSESLGTNYSYLSKIINEYKGKSFTIYINDLKLDYLVNLLQTDEQYINKDVKELSYIAGFISPDNFSDNFYRKYQIKPSFFIKMLKENVKTSVQSHNQA